MTSVHERMLSDLQALAGTEAPENLTLDTIMHKMPRGIRHLYLATGIPESTCSRDIKLLATDLASTPVRPCTITLSCSSQDKFHNYQLVTINLSVAGKGDMQMPHGGLCKPVPNHVGARCTVCRASLPAQRSHHCHFIATVQFQCAELLRWDKITSSAAACMQVVSDHNLTALFPTDTSATVLLSAEHMGAMLERGVSVDTALQTADGVFYRPRPMASSFLVRVDYDMCNQYAQSGKIVPVARITTCGLRNCAVAMYNIIQVAASVFPNVDGIDFAKVCDRDESGAPVLTPFSPQNLLHEIFRACIPPMCSRDSLHLAPNLYFFEQFFRELIFLGCVQNIVPMPQTGATGLKPSEYERLISHLRTFEIKEIAPRAPARNLYREMSFLDSLKCHFPTLPGLDAAVEWDNVVLAIKSASLSAADTDALQTSMKDFMDFFKILLGVFDTEYNRNGRGVLPVVSIDVKMLQTMDGIFWHLGSCARISQKWVLCDNVQRRLLNDDDMEEEAWDRNKRQLPALCHGIALTDTEARASADDALAQLEAIRKRRHELRLQREEAETQKLALHAKRARLALS